MTTDFELIELDPFEAARAVSDAFAAVGVGALEADRISDSLLAAERAGVPTHGLLRAPRYLDAWRSGDVAPCGDVVVEHAATTIARIDGRGSFGHLPAWIATETAGALAQAHGVGIATVRNISEFGRAGYFTGRLADDGLVGIVCQNNRPMIAAPGVSVATHGNNPLAWAAPGPDGPRFDAAFTARSGGELLLRHVLGHEVPPEWEYVDDHGRPTSDPLAALQAPQQAVGGPKGFGIAVLVDVLAGGLAGAASAQEVGSQPADTGAFFLALNPEIVAGTSLDSLWSATADTVRNAGGHWLGDRERSRRDTHAASISLPEPLYEHVQAHIGALADCRR